MVYQTYQNEEIEEMISNGNSIEIKTLKSMLDLGITNFSIQALLGNKEVGNPSFWNGISGKDIPELIIAPLDKHAKLFISKDSANYQGYINNELGLGIPDAQKRREIQNRIDLNECLANFIYHARMFGKVTKVKLNGSLHAELSYVTMNKDGSGTSLHSIQFVDARNLLESANPMEIINPEIKTVIIPRSFEMVDDYFQTPLLMDFSEKLIRSGFNFGFGVDVEKFFFLSNNGIAFTDNLTLLSTTYSNNFIKGYGENPYEIGIDLLDPDPIRDKRLEVYGVNIELGKVQLENSGIARSIIDEISKLVIQKGLHISKSLKNSFKYNADEIFDIDSMIRMDTYEELNELSKSLGHLNYIEMISDMSPKKESY